MEYLKYIVDALYVVLAVVTMVIFVKRGFLESAFRFGRTIAAAVICFLAGPHVSKLIYDKWIYPGIFEWATEKVEIFLSSTVGAIDVNGMIDALPFFIRQLVDREAVTAKYGITADMHAKAQDFAATAASPLSSLLSNLIAYVSVFLLSVVLLFLLFKLLNGLSRLPVLNAINKTLGFLLGLLATCLLLAAFTYLLGLLLGVLGSTSMLKKLIERSPTFRFFNDISIFNLF